MTSSDLKQRRLLGKLLFATGIGLFAVWTYYFVNLLRPIDLWDFCPLPVALALIVLGIRSTGLGELIVVQASVSYKRDLVLGLGLGILAELSLWAFLFFAVGDDPEMAERYIALDRLQEPAVKVGLPIYRYLYPLLGSAFGRYVALGLSLMVLIAMWNLVAFALLRIVRLFAKSHSRSLGTGAEPVR